MVNKFLLDTDCIIDSRNGMPDAIALLTALAKDGAAISLITYGELHEGAYYARDQSGALAALAAFVRNKPMLPATAPVMERFGIVRGQLTRQLRQQIGDMDLIIAATALSYDLTLVTRNLRDFQHIPNLDLYSTE